MKNLLGGVGLLGPGPPRLVAHLLPRNLPAAGRKGLMTFA